MKKLIIATLCCYLSAGIFAHNPLAAKFELEATPPGVSLLHVYLSQTGLHQALLQHCSATDFNNVSPEEYKRLVVRYVKEHVRLTADGTQLLLGEGGIKLGNHETDLKFIVENYPRRVESLSVAIGAFAENTHHASVFWWKRNSEKSKLILSEENDYRGRWRNSRLGQQRKERY